jgi:hypothetical protein
MTIPTSSFEAFTAALHAPAPVLDVVLPAR